MIKALIVDDEVKARNVLHHYITHFIPEIGEVRLADSADAADEILKHFTPDIVFLDVEMPHRNGFDFLAALPDAGFDVVFTTAFNHYAIQAIRFSALDYLLKPVDPDELKASVQRHLDRKGEDTGNKDLVRNLVGNVAKKDVAAFQIAVPATDGIHFFKVEEILRLEADRSYTHIHLKGKKPFIASRTLRHFEEMLEEFRFVRTHKSHLVNADHITRVSADRDALHLSDGSTVEISRRKKDEVLQMLGARGNAN
jgi:two-component system LytT family response regulator